MSIALKTSLSTFLAVLPFIIFSTVIESELFYDVKASGAVLAACAIGVAHHSQRIPHNSIRHLLAGSLLYALVVCLLYVAVLSLIAYIGTLSDGLYILTNTMGEARFLTPKLIFPALFSYVVIRQFYSRGESSATAT
jgi:hypothetical protein